MAIKTVSPGVVSTSVSLAGFNEMIVSSGGSAAATSVGSGGDLYVESGGAASATVVSSNGGLFVTGISVSATVNAGGFEYVVGGTVGDSVIERGAIERLGAGGDAYGSQIFAGGVQQAGAGSFANGVTVGSGAAQFVSSGAVVVSTIVQAGGFEEVLSGGVASLTSVASGGTLVVLPGAVITSDTVAVGGAVVSVGVVFNPYPPAVVLDGPRVADLAIGASASDFVLSGGLAEGSVVSSGGAQFIEGGAASGTVLRAGGIENVSQGSAIGTTVSGGVASVYSLQNVAAGGVASGTWVYAGGAQNISGGRAEATRLSAGAQFVEAGGVASGAYIAAGGYQFIGAGGTATATSVASGGSQNVSGGTAYGTTQAGGGEDFVAFGGVLSGATLSGITRLGPGGILSAGALAAGELIIDGGAAYNTVLQGSVAVLSGNTTYATAVSEAFGTTINAGAAEVVAARGLETNPTIAGGALVLAGGLVSGGVDLSGIGDKLILDEPDFSNLVTGFTIADAIELAQISYSSTASLSVTGPNQVVISASGSTFTLNIAGAQLAAGHFQLGAGSDGAIILTETAPCFAVGTRILTPVGDVPVEELRPGDLVITVDGTDAPIIWIGQRRLDIARHPRPETVRPVRIAANSFGEGAPRRDLLVSPDHALFVEGVLIPAKALINGRNIHQISPALVTYYHVELAEHAVIFAEGMAAESYLETGNRCAFENGGAAVALHPDFAQTVREQQSCARFVESGPVVEAVALSLLERHYGMRAADHQAGYDRSISRINLSLRTLKA